MKAVLIIDVSDNILLGFSKANIEIKENAYIVSKNENAWKYTRPIKIEDVPLRPLPQKKSHKEYSWNAEKIETINDYENGWNDCLDKITGETE